MKYDLLLKEKEKERQIENDHSSKSTKVSNYIFLLFDYLGRYILPRYYLPSIFN